MLNVTSPFKLTDNKYGNLNIPVVQNIQYLQFRQSCLFTL